MAYNSSKGPQQHGDIKFEGDPLETQIDFENDFIALKASGSQVLIVSGTHVGVLTPSPAAHPAGKNDFVIGNQSGHRGTTIASGPTSISTLRFTYATAANNGEGWIDYSNNSKKMRFGTNGLNTRMTISDTDISSSLTISASAFYANGVVLGGGMSSFTLAGDGGSSQAITNGNTLTVAGGTGLSSTAAATDTVTVKLDDTSVSAGSYTYSAITVDDQGRLTAAANGTAPPITTYSNAADNRVITSVNATSVQGETGLTYNGSILAATGQVSASLGVSGSAVYADQGLVVRTGTNFASVINGTHISSSLNISGSALYVDSPGIMEIHKSTNGHAQIRTQTAHFQIRNKANNKDIRFQLGEDAGATGVKIRNNSSADVASIDSQGDAILRHLSASLGVTGSSLHTPTTVINATHVSSSLHVSASKFFANGVEVGGGGAVTTYTNAADNRIITSVNSNTINGEARLTFDGSTNFLFLSGNAQVRNHLPTIFFSNSAGTGLGYMGYNSSDNILFQNNVSNKHIVFKANDNGNIREGFRLDGGVPEVVINQGSDSLVDFRVESDNNTHMIFSDGANDRVGINTSIPTHTLSVSGTMQVSGSFTAKTLEWTRTAFQYGATSEIWIPFEGTGESNSPDWENQFIAPFPGSLKRILVRPENTQNGNISASVWFAANTVAEIGSGTRAEDAIGANAGSYTTTTINFTGSNHFAPGDIVGVSIKPRLNPGKINLTCIWEFDKTIF